jgi:aminopeptidase C
VSNDPYRFGRCEHISATPARGAGLLPKYAVGATRNNGASSTFNSALTNLLRNHQKILQKIN